MKRKRNTISYIVSNLNGRIRVARQIFSDLCVTTPLLDFLGKDRSCAIVGGAVRDVLLMSDPWTIQMFHQWPDIDIAVVDDLSELPIVANSISSNGATISTNTFGGLKVSHESLGSLDIWTWRKPGLNNTSLKDWRERLNMVEFGLCCCVRLARARNSNSSSMDQRPEKWAPGREGLFITCAEGDTNR